MLEDNDATLPAKLILKFNERTTAGSDVHYLTVLSRLKVPLTTNHLATIANALLSLDRKVEGQQMRSKQNWSIRLAEIVAQLVSHHPTLADAIMRHPNFVSPGHVALVPSLGSAKRLPQPKHFSRALARSQTLFGRHSFVLICSRIAA